MVGMLKTLSFSQFPQVFPQGKKRGKISPFVFKMVYIRLFDRLRQNPNFFVSSNIHKAQNSARKKALDKINKCKMQNEGVGFADLLKYLCFQFVRQLEFV